MSEDYWNSDAGQFIADSLRYLRAAQIIRYSGKFTDQLHPPTLHLLSHGIELLCKFRLLSLGMSQATITKAYGHDLKALWHLPENRNLRTLVYLEGSKVWDAARSSGNWPHEDFSGDPARYLDQSIDYLAYLHGRDSNFALRYALDLDALAPHPAFMIDTFYQVSERLVMNTSMLDFDLP